MKYFAYGSNMSKDRMIKRGLNFTSRKSATLNGYKLLFNKKAASGDFSYANISPITDSFVEGALYEFPDEEIKMLDKAEGYPNHYVKILVDVIDSTGNSITATTYIAKKDKIVAGLMPNKDYLDCILKGKDILSNGYFEFLLKVRTN